MNVKKKRLLAMAAIAMVGAGVMMTLRPSVAAPVDLRAADSFEGIQ